MIRRFINLFYFHLKIYAKNQYFLWLTISSTIAIFILQYIIAYTTNKLDDSYIWIRSGIFGLWSSSTTATGVIGFQRYQGTLIYLINNQIDDRQSMAALILPAASFGLLAFPIAFLLSMILGVTHSNVSIILIFYIILLWLGAVIMDFFIATFFVLTTNAIVYEQLILIPIVLVSGLFFNPLNNIFTFIIPISAPIHLLLSKFEFINIVQFFTSSILWLSFTWYLSKKIITMARKTGNMRLM